MTAVAAAVVSAVLVAACGGPDASSTIRVQGTTDTVDSGLVDRLIRPGYRTAQPEDGLEYAGVGTGKALENAEAGLADVVLTHSPKQEQEFVAKGYAYGGKGRPLFHSDYVIVGPESDPAGLAAGAFHDAAGAFRLIAAAGKDGKATFLSRGDRSGTNDKEIEIWNLAKIRPGGAWYARTGKGQAANLLETAACSKSSHPDGGCYTILDRGTYDRQVADGVVTDLKIVSSGNAAWAPGGSRLLINQFSVFIVDPAKVRGVNLAGAKRFVAYLTSPGFRAALASFPTAARPAFIAGRYGGG